MTMISFTEALNSEDIVTRTHSQYVGDLIIGIQEMIFRLAEVTCVSYKEREQLQSAIKYGGMMHDIGKIKIPKRIITKPGKLTDLEYETVKKHTTLGSAMVPNFNIPLPGVYKSIAGNMVLLHHERWDGFGYPMGMCGYQIPLEARITSILDTYEAIRAERPYKRRKTHYEAVDEILKCSGSQFDPEIVLEFLNQEHIVESLYRSISNR